MILPSLTSAETNYIAFDIVSTDYHIALYGYLQHKIGDKNVKDTDTHIKSCSCYNASIHSKLTSFKTTTYETLPTAIRNAIHHPSPSTNFTQEELRTSTELLIEILKNTP